MVLLTVPTVIGSEKLLLPPPLKDEPPLAIIAALVVSEGLIGVPPPPPELPEKPPPIPPKPPPPPPTPPPPGPSATAVEGVWPVCSAAVTFVMLVMLVVLFVMLVVPPRGGRPTNARMGFTIVFGISVIGDDPPVPDEQLAKAGIGPATAARATSSVMATRMGPVLLPSDISRRVP